MEEQLRRRGLVMAFVGMLLISSDSFFIRLADVDGFDVTFWVGLLSAAVLFTISIVVHDINPIRGIRDGGWPLWLAGALQAGSTSLFVLAVTMTSVSTSWSSSQPPPCSPLV